MCLLTFLSVYARTQCTMVVLHLLSPSAGCPPLGVHSLTVCMLDSYDSLRFFVLFAKGSWSPSPPLKEGNLTDTLNSTQRSLTQSSTLDSSDSTTEPVSPEATVTHAPSSASLLHLFMYYLDSSLRLARSAFRMLNDLII